MMGRLRIGITLGRASEDLTDLLWSSGINQNAVLLGLLCQRLPMIGEVVFVDCSGRPPPHPLGAWSGIPTIDPAAAAGRLDIIVECGARAEVAAMTSFRDRGGRLVSYMAGNAMALNFEALSSGLPHGEFMSDVPFDAVWITPQHWTMNRDLARITRSPNVSVAPHLWEPLFLTEYARTHGLNPFYKPDRERPARIGVLEPNVNVLKTFHLPLLVCEEAYRAEPSAVAEVLLFNTRHLVGTPHFDDLTTLLDLFGAGRLFAEGRLATPEILARHVDTVVVHQWENDLNYLYWDVLWTGHPLVHNSPAAGEIGYHYRSFDPADGGRA